MGRHLVRRGFTGSWVVIGPLAGYARGAIERRRDERWKTRAGANRIFDQNVVDYRFFTGPRDGIGLDPIRRERGASFS